MLKNKKILFCAHDAGGGNILLPIIEKLIKNNKLILYPTGPSKQLWINFKSYFVTKKQIDYNAIDLIITGTSHFSDTERNIWYHSYKKQIKSIALLDNSTNVEERFKYLLKEKKIFPHEIFVLSKVCKETVSKLNPSLRVRIIQSPLMNYFSKINKNNSIDNNLILYFCSSKNNMKFEIQANIINKIIKILNPKYKFLIKPHPNDKYNFWENKFSKYLTKEPNLLLFKKAILSISSNSSSLVESVMANIPALNISFKDNDKNFYKDYTKHILNLDYEIFLKLNNFDKIQNNPPLLKKRRNEWYNLINIT